MRHPWYAMVPANTIPAVKSERMLALLCTSVFPQVDATVPGTLDCFATTCHETRLACLPNLEQGMAKLNISSIASKQHRQTSALSFLLGSVSKTRVAGKEQLGSASNVSRSSLGMWRMSSARKASRAVELEVSGMLDDVLGEEG